MARLCEGRIAIVTGAGRGIGREHALSLAAQGAKVVVNDLGGNVDGSGGDLSPAQQVVEEIKAMGGEAVANGDSVSDYEGAARMIQTAIDTFGDLHIVVNNAGILRDKSFQNMEPDMVKAVLDVHLAGAFNVTQPAFKLMREQGYGRIVSTSSAAGIFGNFGQANYGAAKMGLVGFTRVLAVEGAKYNVKANAIAPLAYTRMTENLLGNLGERLDPSFVSPIVAYLAHEECPVSGEVYSVGGGRVARVFIAESQGYFNPTLTLEDVRDNFDTIRSEVDYKVPANIGEETAMYLPFFK